MCHQLHLSLPESLLHSYVHSHSQVKYIEYQKTIHRYSSCTMVCHVSIRLKAVLGTSYYKVLVIDLEHAALVLSMRLPSYTLFQIYTWANMLKTDHCWKRFRDVSASSPGCCKQAGIHMSEYGMIKCGFKVKSQSDILNRVLSRKHVSVASVASKTTGFFTT